VESKNKRRKNVEEFLDTLWSRKNKGNSFWGITAILTYGEKQ